MRTKTKYHHGDLRESLIAAAFQLVCERGAEHFTLADACRLAGVSTREMILSKRRVTTTFNPTLSLHYIEKFSPKYILRAIWLSMISLATPLVKMVPLLTI